MHETSYLAVGNLVFYCVANTLGFLYVNVSNMNLSRKSVLFSNHESRCDFVMTVLMAPLFYFIGNNVAMRAEYDMTENSQNKHDDDPDYSYWECISYNMSLWATAFAFGLQFTHFDVSFMRGFSLSPEHIRRWNGGIWTVAIVLLIIMLGGLGYLIYLWNSAGIVWAFFAILGVELIFFVTVTCVLKRTHYLHVHHYTWAMMCLPLLSLQAGFATFLCGWINGVMIEGGARWGYDPIWIRKKPRRESECN